MRKPEYQTTMWAQIDEIPQTDWKLPETFPNLSSAKAIALDTETYDPELIKHGPGWARGIGHIVGVSIGVSDKQWYFPIRHEIEPEINLEPEKVFAWLKEILDTPKVVKIGANLLYDLGWLRQEGVKVSGRLIDVQFAEALLTETAKVDLDTLSKKYLNVGKESNLLYSWCAKAYGGEADGKQRANIYRAPARLVGAYAEADANLPFRLARKMFPLLQKENLTNLFSVENRLIPLLIDMRFAGVSVDIPKAERLRELLINKAKEASEKLNAMVGFEVNVNASSSLSSAFKKLDIPYNLTDKGAPSFTGIFLKNLKHPVGTLIREVKTNQKMVSTFIEGYILNSHIKGKIHAEFHPLRSHAGGTRSGRFSSSHPNLQNIPSRDNFLAPLLRGVFIPDAGHVAWRKYDYSQIEYRFLAHFAVGKGADEVRQKYLDNPKTDYHNFIQEMIKEKSGVLLPRKKAKNINFGLIYGMGASMLAKNIGLNKAEANTLFSTFHKSAPFIKATTENAMQEASETGEISTILNRKSRFEMWESENYHEKGAPLPREKAVIAYGEVKRAFVYRALNRILQGSAADLMKMAMLKCYESGIFSETGLPRLTVHDELDFSDPGGKDTAFVEMQKIMDTAIDLKVPVLTDVEIGKDWGNLKPF